MSIGKLGYIFAKIKEKILKNKECINDFYRRWGVLVGRNTIICGYMRISEPQLVEIKADCVISSNVTFITHDHSINKVTNQGSNLFGRIVVGNNCFVGQNATLLYGVELADNIIVGSGSVVTKSFKENNIIIAGNPAKKISTWEQFKDRYESLAANRDELNDIIAQKSKKIIRR